MLMRVSPPRCCQDADADHCHADAADMLPRRRHAATYAMLRLRCRY